MASTTTTLLSTSTTTSQSQRFQQQLKRQETAGSSSNMAIHRAPGVLILGPIDGAEQARILSVEAQAFVATLHRCFNTRRKELLARRVTRQYEIDAGVGLGAFSPAVALDTYTLVYVHMSGRPRAQCRAFE